MKTGSRHGATATNYPSLPDRRINEISPKKKHYRANEIVALTLNKRITEMG